jgi:hypothetical protein
MLPPSLKETEDGSGCLDDNSGSCTTSSKAPRKSVRFSTDAAHDHESAKRSTWPAAWAAAGSGDGGDERSLAALVDNQSDGVGGSGSPGVAKAGRRKEATECAADAERHGLLPSWRLKMPVVERCAPASFCRKLTFWML